MGKEKYLAAAAFLILSLCIMSDRVCAVTSVVSVSQFASWNVAAFSGSDVTYPANVSFLLSFNNNGTADLNVSGNLSVIKDGSAIYSGWVFTSNVSAQHNGSIAFAWTPSSSGDFIANLSLNVSSSGLGLSNRTFALDSFTVYSPPSQPPGGGSVGTNVPAPNATNASGATPVLWRASWEKILPGILAFGTNNSHLAFTEINLNVVQETNGASIEIRNVSAPLDFSGAGSRVRIYQFIQVAEKNLGGIVYGAEISFRIDRNWLLREGVNGSAIALNRRSDDTGAWERYPATLMSEDAAFAHYSAVVPALSLFYISGLANMECAPHEKLCSGSILQECSPEGWWKFTECGSGCDRATLECVPLRACSGQEMRCSGDVLQRCSADGYGWDNLETCRYGCWDNECKELYASLVTKMAVFAMTIIFFAIVVIMIAMVYLNVKAFVVRKKVN